MKKKKQRVGYTTEGKKAKMPEATPFSRTGFTNKTNLYPEATGKKRTSIGKGKTEVYKGKFILPQKETDKLTALGKPTQENIDNQKIKDFKKKQLLNKIAFEEKPKENKNKPGTQPPINNSPQQNPGLFDKIKASGQGVNLQGKNETEQRTALDISRKNQGLNPLTDEEWNRFNNPLEQLKEHPFKELGAVAPLAITTGIGTDKVLGAGIKSFSEWAIGKRITNQAVKTFIKSGAFKFINKVGLFGGLMIWLASDNIGTLASMYSNKVIKQVQNGKMSSEKGLELIDKAQEKVSYAKNVASISSLYPIFFPFRKLIMSNFNGLNQTFDLNRQIIQQAGTPEATAKRNQETAYWDTIQKQKLGIS